MNIRILAASALALAILVPAANAATPSRERPTPVRNDSDKPDNCPGGNGNLNLGTLECAPIRAKVVHARVVKHVAKPANTAFARMTENQDSNNEMGSSHL